MRKHLKQRHNLAAKPHRSRGTNRLASFGFLLILFPLYFWFTVLLKFELGINFPFNFWNYFYEDYLEFFLILLPIPAFIIGGIAFFRGRRRKAGVLLSAMTVVASIMVGIAWILAAQRPS